MKRVMMGTAISVLRWTLGVVILVQSLIFLLDSRAGQVTHNGGIPNVVRYILGLSEMVASVLFLLPPALVLGGRSLLAVFGMAVVVHLVHGEFNVGGLFVYGAAVLAVLAHRESAIG